jgi:hypothetical protein
MSLLIASITVVYPFLIKKVATNHFMPPVWRGPSAAKKKRVKPNLSISARSAVEDLVALLLIDSIKGRHVLILETLDL